MYHPTQAIFFDTIAATVITEMEAVAYKGAGKPSGPHTFSWDLEQKIEERIKRQEKIAAEQARSLDND